jgi:tRNA(Ile)-lysidine synthetase-like protein
MDHKNLLKFWFNDHKKYWFGCPLHIDELIKKKFLNILLDEKIENNYSEYSNEQILAKIILCDQISRHIYRNSPSEIKKYDEIALNIIKSTNILFYIDNFLPEERCFLLLPLRHTFNELLLKICIEYVIKWRKIKDYPIYKRFYHATLKAYSKILTNKDLLYKSEKIYNQNQIISVLDKLSKYNLEKLSIHNLNKLDNHNLLYKTFSINIPNEYNGNLTVSVSGGVDSMVCLFLLKKLALNNSRINPIAVSINYKNRNEQDIEIYLVNLVCNILEIPHYVREINEIQRSRDGYRELYEEHTREIRFNTYLKIGGPIILGHNLDDTLENIFSNIKKQKNYDNLFGMSIHSTERKVDIWRPLLSISKKTIILFAKENNIPFIYDSTPEWSERGLLRDKLIPYINNFDSNILYGLYTLCNNFKEIYKIYEKSLPSIIYFETYCIIDNKESIIFFDYWKKILINIMNYYHYTHIKNKSIKHMIERIIEKSNKRITLSKNSIMQIVNENIYIYLNES